MKKKVFALIIAFSMLFAVLAGCNRSGVIGGGGGTTTESDPIKVKLITVGWSNTPIDSFEADPYWNFLRDEYGLEVTLMNYNLNDFKNKVSTLFTNAAESPDIIAFPNYEEFVKVYEQGVLIDDWTPYLDSMPLMKNVIELNPYDFETPNPVKNMFMEGEDLTALWIVPEPVKWGLKIRQDWVVELGYPEGWYPTDVEEVLEFARKVKDNKILAGERKGQPLCDIPNTQPYCFTSSGSKLTSGDFGALSINMFGSHTWNVKEGKLTHPILDNTYQRAWDFMKTVVDEGLIYPAWYEQNFQDMQLSAFNDQVAIVNMTSTIVSTTYNKHMAGGTQFTAEETLDWWGSMPTPKAEGTDGGLLTSTGYFSKILTVSKRTAADATKMERICKLFNDVSQNYDYDKAGTDDFFIRDETYDMLRWGVGLENDEIKMLDVEGTSYKYCNVNAPVGEDLYYRQNVPGAWDWGAWFSTTGDGVIQGKGVEEVTAVAQKEAQFLEEIQTYPVRETLYFLDVDAALNAQLTDLQKEYEVLYMTKGNISDSAINQFYKEFVELWWNEGGREMFYEVAQQFIDEGYEISNADAQLSDFAYYRT